MEGGQRQWALAVLVLRVHEIVFVLAGQVATVEHVLSETAGGPRGLGGVSGLADSDVLREQSGSLPVQENLHVDEYLCKVRACSRQRIHPFIEVQAPKPFLGLFKGRRLCWLHRSLVFDCWFIDFIRINIDRTFFSHLLLKINANTADLFVLTA